ncbi:MAG: hypothetical protein RSG52_00660 [Terrisporobacter sp.]|uniref:hypothetical protein n=1 Tax=Terrisporobacter sp. TaxID=1965305 RepID=UPI002FC9177F
MGIIVNELKKIFNIKSIILIFFITVIMYKIFIIPSESISEQSEFINNIHVEMVKKYGNTMDENEYKDFLNTYNEKAKIADEYVKKDKDFSRL